MAFPTPPTNNQILTHRHADPNNAELHGYPKLPSLAEWKKDSFVGTIFSPRRADDLALTRIDEQVDLYSRSKEGQRLYVMADIFFTSMWWLNNFKFQPNKMDARRRPAILRLNLCAANHVAKLLRCSVGEVASKLQAIYGTGMSIHGHRVDSSQHPHYLTIAEREQWRVFFWTGRAYSLNLQGDALVPVNTKHFYTEGRSGKGFVMTVSGSFFVAPLGAGVKFHSCFMGGEAILCAGTIKIKDGQITRIKNDSGHYQPVDATLAQLLRKLQFSGVDISKITVECKRPDVLSEPPSMAGDKFLQANGNWAKAQPVRITLPKAA
jgi:hypothetical protein